MAAIKEYVMKKRAEIMMRPPKPQQAVLKMTKKETPKKEPTPAKPKQESPPAKDRSEERKKEEELLKKAEELKQLQIVREKKNRLREQRKLDMEIQRKQMED